MATAAVAKALKNPEARTPLLNKSRSRVIVNHDSIECMTPETDKMVRGTFVNIECPGQTAKVCGHYYKHMQYFEKVFEDNEVCTIPLSVARFINERCKAIKHKYLVDQNGQPLKGDEYQARYKFLIESFV